MSLPPTFLHRNFRTTVPSSLGRCLPSLILGALTLGTNAIGGPPLLTDDPGTPGPNHWEINFAGTSENTKDEWKFEVPLLDLNYGIGEHLQLKYEVPLVVLDAKNEAACAGIGNSLIGVKWRFLDQDKAWLDVSTYPQFEFNHGNSSVNLSLAEPGSSLLLPFELSHKFQRLTVYGEVGFSFNQRRSDEWLYGIAAEYEISEKFSIMGEFHGGGDYRLHDDQLVSNIGLHWQFSKNLSLLTSVGRAVRSTQPGEPRFLSYVALQCTF